MGGPALKPQLEIAGASRPFPGEAENGDSWTVWESVHGRRVAVIDGLGHGPLAAEAAAQLRRLLLDVPDERLEQVVERAARRMQGGRGAVAAVVEVGERRLTFLGVGNVEGRLWQPGREQRLVGERGFFGGVPRSARPLTFDVPGAWSLYLYTDGVSSRFPLPVDGGRQEPQAVVDAILEGHARATDDATVVMVREAAGAS
ncbi:MAG: SpoIIE family protein phosphatase [Dehalococcoidia bacterium]